MPFSHKKSAASRRQNVILVNILIKMQNINIARLIEFYHLANEIYCVFGRRSRTAFFNVLNWYRGDNYGHIFNSFFMKLSHNNLLYHRRSDPLIRMR